MNFDVRSRTILFVRHGSHAYGLNVATSDEDFKGVCVKPKSAYLGFLENFEQFEHMGSKDDGVDSVTYSLDKFAKLASDCNPNIIEVLHVDDSDVIAIDEFGEELRGMRNMFMSRKAKHTFSGYAHAQLKRIKTHRMWLTQSAPKPPTRTEFGLSQSGKISAAELGAFESATARGLEIETSKEVLDMFLREKQYAAAKTHYDQYVSWVQTRNPARAALETKFGYDTKHGMHLLRLMRMCKEILVTGIVNVKRLDDVHDLLDVRYGRRHYDSLVEEAERLERECDELYLTSPLPKEPDRKALDRMIVSMTERYLSKHG